MLSARSGALTFVQHSYAGLHSTSGVSGVRLRFAPADARHPLRSAAALLRCASLSLRPLGRSKKRCLSTATQSLGVFVRCRQSRPLWCQLPEWLRRRLTPLALSSVGSADVRSAQLRRAALHFGVVGWQTRCARPATQQPLRYAAALLRQASLSPCPLLRSVKKRCLALLRRAKRFLCGVGCAVRLGTRQLNGYADG